MLNIILFFTSYISFIGLTFFYLPIFAFVLYESVYFFTPQYRWWGSNIPDLSYSFFSVVIMFIAMLLNYKQTKENAILAIPQLRWFLFLVTLYGLAYFYAVSPELHLEAAIDFVKLFIIVCIAFKLCDTNQKFDYVLYGYIFGAWYISFLTWQTGRNSGNRVEGIGTVDAPDANGIAAATAPSLVLCLYYFWIHKKPVIKALFAIAGVFIANAFVLINSRGAFLAVGFSMIFFMFYLYFSSYQRKNQKKMAVLFTLCGLIGVVYLADETFIDRLKTLNTSSSSVSFERESGATRTQFWLASIEMAKDYPMGNGFRGFDHYSELYIPDHINTGSSRSRSVHSSWFEVLSEIGYLGLTVFILMLYSCARTLKKCKQALRHTNDVDNYFKIIAIQSACFAFIIAMTFMNRMRAEILYWLVLYTAIAYNIYVLKAKTQSTSNSHALATID